MSTRHAYVDTAIGAMLIVARGASVIGAYFDEHMYPPAAEVIGARTTEAADQTIAEAANQLRQYLAGSRREFEISLATNGDDFSERVWHELRNIPYGSTTSYGAIAAAVGSPGAAQRVGQAVGHNPLMIFIPCHRVVGADGSLTGYAGGLDRKRTLLALEEPEASSVNRLF